MENVEHNLHSLIWKNHLMSASAWELVGNWDMALHSCEVIPILY